MIGIEKTEFFNYDIKNVDLFTELMSYTASVNSVMRKTQNLLK